MDKEKVALVIGKQIIEQIINFQENGKDFGQELVIPFKLPQLSDEPDFVYTVKLGMPRYIVHKNGNFETITMAKHYGWISQSEKGG